MERYIKTISLLITLSLLTGCNKKYINNNYNAYSEYNIEDSNIIISNDVNYFKEDYINIVDACNGINPDYKIIDSYKINDIKLMNEIIDVIYDYNSNHNYDWNRNRISLISEWLFHNLFYDLDIMTENTKDVDFNQHELIKHIHL